MASVIGDSKGETDINGKEVIIRHIYAVQQMPACDRYGRCASLQCDDGPSPNPQRPTAACSPHQPTHKPKRGFLNALIDQCTGTCQVNMIRNLQKIPDAK